jgi:hypothetical protein
VNPPGGVDLFLDGVRLSAPRRSRRERNPVVGFSAFPGVFAI